MKCVWRLFATTGFCLFCTAAQANWLLVDDFEGFNTRPGTLDGVNGWVETSGLHSGSDFKVDPDPDVAGNQALRVIRDTHTIDSSAYKVLPQPIAAGSTGTLFFRTRNFIDPAVPNRPDSGGNPTPGTSPGGDLGAGLSDSLTPNGWGNFEAYFVTASGAMRGRDNGAPWVDLGSYQADTWFNVWVVADAGASQEADYYVSTGTDPAQYVGTGRFRRGDGNDLSSFLVRTGFGQGFAGYIDDIYVNPMGQSLSNPLNAVPEPVSLWLSGVVGAVVISRRRPRR